KDEAMFSNIQRVMLDQANIVSAINSDQSYTRTQLQSLFNKTTQRLSVPSAAQLKPIEQSIERLKTNLERYKKAPKQGREVEISDKITRGTQGLIAIIEQQKKALEEMDQQQFNEGSERVSTPAQIFNEGLSELTGYTETISQQVESEFDQLRYVFNWVYGVLIALAVLLVFMLYSGLRNLVIMPLETAGKELTKIANSDLTADILVMSKNEIAQLFATMSHMQKRLHNVVNQVRS